MHEKDKANLIDCLYSIEHIEEYIQNIQTADKLLEDSKTYDAVLMNFVIIAEACKRISNELQQKYPEVPWNEIRGFRNYIAHDYFGLDIDVIWQSVTIEIPKLKTVFNRIINENS